MDPHLESYQKETKQIAEEPRVCTLVEYLKHNKRIEKLKLFLARNFCETDKAEGLCDTHAPATNS